MLPGLFFDALFSIRYFRTSRIHFHAIRIGGNLMVQTHNHASLTSDFDAWLETLAYASGVFASEAVARTWSIQFPWPDRPDFYRSGLPMRALAATMPKKNGLGSLSPSTVIDRIGILRRLELFEDQESLADAFCRCRPIIQPTTVKGEYSE